MSELFIVTVLRQPLWLLLLLVPLVSAIYHTISLRMTLPTKYFDHSMHYWYLNTNTSYKNSVRKSLILNVLFWLFFSLALSGPEYAEVIDSNKKSNGDNVMILMDVSQSMSSLDETPSRLLRAKNELLNLIDKININDRLGVILFSGSSHLLFSPTNDKEVMRFFVGKIQESILPVSGSLIDKALRHSQQILLLSDNIKGEFSHIILMTDGDVENDSLVLNKVEALHLTYPVHVVGIGQQINAPVPALKDKQPWLLNESGEVITSNRNDDLLQLIASKTGGEYTVLSSNKTMLDSLYQTKIQSKSFTEVEKGNTNWVQLYHLFLFLSVIIFFYQRILSSNN